MIGIACGFFLGWNLMRFIRLMIQGFTVGFDTWTRADWYLWLAWVLVLGFFMLKLFSR